jgi:hypothetical protein
LLEDLRGSGFREAASRLAERAATEASLTHPGFAGYLLAELRESGKEAEFLRRDPVSQADLWNLAAVARLARELGEADAVDSAIRLADRVEPPHAAKLLKELLARECVPEVVYVAARKAVAHVDPSRPAQVSTLLSLLHEADASDLIRELAAQATGLLDVSNPSTITRTIRLLDLAGEHGTARTVAKRAAADSSVAEAAAVASLIREILKLGLHEEASQLADRAVGTSDQRLPALVDLLAAMNEAGAANARTVLAQRGAAAIDPGIHGPEEAAIAQLLDALHDTGQDVVIDRMLRDLLAREGVENANAVRFALEHSCRLGISAVQGELENGVLPVVSLADPRAAGALIGELRRTGVTAIADVADRAAREALVDAEGVATLLKELRDAGLATAATILIGRINDEGNPGLRELKLVVDELRQQGGDGIHSVVDRVMETAKRDDPYARLHMLGTLSGLRYSRDAIETLARDTPLVIGFSDGLRADVEYIYMALREIPRALREVGAWEALDEFADRAAGQGDFDQMREAAPEWASRFPHGRTPKGHPEPAWGWKDLENKNSDES